MSGLKERRPITQLSTAKGTSLIQMHGELEDMHSPIVVTAMREEVA